jgi:hypothetical protein
VEITSGLTCRRVQAGLPIAAIQFFPRPDPKPGQLVSVPRRST